jgi:uroporphyrinogen-III decarboxylase
LDEQPFIRDILKAIQVFSKENSGAKTLLLKVNGPYSVLAALAPPRLFYRWIAKHPHEVHIGLARLSAGLSGYIRAAFRRGVRILSLADPFANSAIMGEPRCRIFAGFWLLKLLEKITQTPGRIIHLCPHSSLMLERAGFVTSENLRIAQPAVSYLDYLLAIPAENTSPIFGHQCIAAQKTERIIRLRIT